MRNSWLTPSVTFRRSHFPVLSQQESFGHLTDNYIVYSASLHVTLRTMRPVCLVLFLINTAPTAEGGQVRLHRRGLHHGDCPAFRWYPGKFFTPSHPRLEHRNTHHCSILPSTKLSNHLPALRGLVLEELDLRVSKSRFPRVALSPSNVCTVGLSIVPLYNSGAFWVLGWT